MVFGLDKALSVDSVQIIWNNNKCQTLKSIKTNTSIKLEEKNAKDTYNYQITAKNPILVSAESINFVDYKSVINDFKLQPLLPNMISNMGPKMAYGDVNNDGFEDFYVCGGKNQAGKLFLGLKNGFKESINPVFDKHKDFQDSDVVFLDVDKDNDLDICVISEGYALSKNNNLLRPRIYINNGNANFSEGNTINVFANASTVSSLDVNQDGFLDIFIGTRSNFESFPTASESFILINDRKGNFKKGSFPSLNNLGSISDSFVSNIDSDKNQELVLTTDFGEVITIKVIKNKLLKTPNNFGTGMHNCLISKDFDNDGDSDLVIGNIGKNYQPIKNTDDKLTMYFGDFNASGRIIPILCFDENGKTYPFVARDELLDQIPELKKKYIDYVSYSKATIDDILANIKNKIFQKIEIKNFETQYFENIKGKFITKKLPIQAQFSPVFAIEALDLNNDGYLDLVLGGNLKKTRVRIGQVDANYVQVYINNKKGDFVYHSDLGVKGDVRDIKFINNRLIIAVNENEIKSFRIK